MLLTQLRFERERGDNIPLWWWLWSTVILCQPLWIFHSRSVGPCGELKENGLFGKQTSETFPFSFQSFVMYSKVISSKRYFFSSLTQEAKVKLLKKCIEIANPMQCIFRYRWARHIQWTCLQACARWLTWRRYLRYDAQEIRSCWSPHGMADLNVRCSA